MQAWSDEGETILVSVQKTDKFDSQRACTGIVQVEEFRSIEASLYQVLPQNDSKRTAEKIGQQTNGQQGFEARRAIVRSYDYRNMSDINSAYAALISNISERDRRKDVEQVDDVLRTFINETNETREQIRHSQR